MDKDKSQYMGHQKCRKCGYPTEEISGNEVRCSNPKCGQVQSWEYV